MLGHPEFYVPIPAEIFCAVLWINFWIFFTFILSSLWVQTLFIFFSWIKKAEHNVLDLQYF